jgi:spermidine synthase
MSRRTRLHLVAFLSGAAGLGYEIVWTRMLALGLGHELPAVLAVLTAFFLGLAAGGWLSERRALAAAPPAPVYAALEGIIGGWALATIALVPAVNRAVGTWIGPSPSAFHHWAVAFLVPFALLLPATCAMGATLPAMARLVAWTGEGERIAPGLYAANTGGAVVGTLAATFALVPHLGYGATLAVLALLNLACAGLTPLAARGARPDPARARPRAAPPAPPVRALSFLLFATGLLGLGYEVLVVRLLSQVQENTVYSFASALVVYLLGTAAGAALYHRLAGRLRRDPLPALLTSVASACVASALAMTRALELQAVLARTFGPGMTAAVAAELALAAVAFLFPTMAMGATFSHLAEVARARRLGLGGGLGLNTVGGALAPLLFGVWLVPTFGLEVALLVCALGYLALAPLASRRLHLHALLPAAAAGLFAATGPLQLVSLQPGEELVEHVEGVMAAVSVVRDADGDVHLKVNNHFQMGGTSSVFSDLRQGHLPLLLHPDPRSALYLGLGTAVTFSAAADHPGLTAQGVELVPEVVSMVRHFRRATGDLSAAPGLTMVVADARRYVSSARRRWDVIVADLFHPARDGAGAIYTREHFLAVRDRLEEGGVFCQWLPLYQLDLDTFRAILRTFLDAFPDGSAYLAHFSLRQPIVGLVGRKGPTPLAPGWFAARVRDESLAARLRSLHLRDDYDLFGGYLAGPGELRRFAGEGPRNTDDQPLVAFQAPRFTYGPGAPAQDRLLALLDALHARPEEVLGPARVPADRAEQDRLAAYWSARDEYLRAGARVRETRDPEALLAQVREPLLAAVRRSRDFDPAYEPLLALAARLRTSSPGEADQLLLELEQANPWRGEARALREGAPPGALGP